MKIEFRSLLAEEIDVKPQTVKSNGFSLLLYKNARVDMDLLDETVGPMNWQRKHSRENANCIVSIYDEDKKIWIEKEDTGTESFTEKEKGLASDSFKRACFNWGIGRELYTSPFIWISDKKYLKENNGKYAITDKFHISRIEVRNKVITTLEIRDSKNIVAFRYGIKNEKTKELTEEEKKNMVIEAINGRMKEEKDRSFVYDIVAGYKKLTLEDCTVEELKDVNLKLKAKKGE